jgi:mono/diheme cytochrome c family protein
LLTLEEESMLTRVTVALVALVVAFAILGADNPPTIKKVSPSRTSAASGKDMFTTYCAVCHGRDGKGGGPAVAALKMPPPDLTTLAQRSSGKFPELRVYAAIHGDLEMPAHGSKDMPVWGTVFQSMDRDSAAQQMRVSNLTKYVQSIQAK